MTQPIETTEEQFPSEVQDLIDDMREAKQAKIAQIGKYVAKMRDEAVKGRKQSGIETIWEEDEEYYQGVDDANRDSHPWTKSASVSGGVSRTPAKSATRCSSFFNITRQFVESAAARMGDILLPAGDWNFAVKPTPVPDDDPGNINPQMQQSQPVQPMQQIQSPEMQQAQPQPQPVSQQSENERRAEKAEEKIHDWLVECSYHTEVRKVIEDAAKLGTGILKGPFPDKVTIRKASQTNEGMTLDITSRTNPASKYIDVWDFFPDPACGEDIHKGNYVLERDRLTARQLKDLKGLPGYLSDQIDEVLDEGPSKKNYTDGHRVQDSNTTDVDKFEVWYFYGLVDVSALSAMSVKIEEKDSQKDMLPAVVTLVNDTPIKAFINPLDSGEFPYDLMAWQRRAGTPWGIGVARQGRTPQDMLNAAARALMDNAGLSSGPMLILRKGAIVPVDGQWNVTARKVWYATEQADTRSVADAFTAINIPMVQAELSAIIQLAYKMMEDATGIFFIMQGQQGSAPDTVGGMELLHRNASAILRRLARVFDERITEPHIRRYYDWLLMHGPEDCKGDVKIEAVGSTALVEREIQAMEAFQLLQFSLNPVYGLDPELAMQEVLKAKRFIPEKWKLSDDKKQQAAQQQPPVVPAIEVAKMRSADKEKELQHDTWKTKVTTNANIRRMEVDTDRDAAYTESMSRRDQITANLRIEELRLKRELALLDYSNKRGISLDQIKAELAREAMKLKTQKELAGVATVAAKQVATPAVEPPQHAPDGRAFQE